MAGTRGLSEQERFWNKVDKRGPDECWEWTASKMGGSNRIGKYGRFSFPHGYEYAHRVSYQWAHGEIPAGMVVRHICDNPPCVNPAHLTLGTRSENNADSVERGRWGYRGVPGNQNARKKPGEGKRKYERRKDAD